MDRVKVAVGVGVAVVLVIALISFFLNPLLGLRSSENAFLERLRDADKVFIVMDVRGSGEKTKQNILQCGTDFAGSPGLVGKEVIPVSFGEEGCVTANGSTSFDECMALLQNGGGMIIYVKKGTGPQYFERGVEVGIGDQYGLGMCSIRVVSS